MLKQDKSENEQVSCKIRERVKEMQINLIRVWHLDFALRAIAA